MGDLEYRKICIDSDYLIDVLRKKPETLKEIKKFELEANLLATTVINSFELYYGAYKTKSQKHVKLVDELLTNLIVLEWKREFSELAGKIRADLEAQGSVIDFRDIFIGVISLKNDYFLLTRNISYFKRIPNLKIIT